MDRWVDGNEIIGRSQEAHKEETETMYIGVPSSQTVCRFVHLGWVLPKFFLAHSLGPSIVYSFYHLRGFFLTVEYSCWIHCALRFDDTFQCAMFWHTVLHVCLFVFVEPENNLSWKSHIASIKMDEAAPRGEYRKVDCSLLIPLLWLYIVSFWPWPHRFGCGERGGFGGWSPAGNITSRFSFTLHRLLQIFVFCRVLRAVS
jgi:hypothetical protein